MKDQYGFDRERLDGAEVIQAICVRVTKGDGTAQDPVREMRYYYSLDGYQIAVHDTRQEEEQCEASTQINCDPLSWLTGYTGGTP